MSYPSSPNSTRSRNRAAALGVVTLSASIALFFLLQWLGRDLLTRRLVGPLSLDLLTMAIIPIAIWAMTWRYVREIDRTERVERDNMSQ